MEVCDYYFGLTCEVDWDKRDNHRDFILISKFFSRSCYLHAPCETLQIILFKEVHILQGNRSVSLRYPLQFNMTETINSCQQHLHRHYKEGDNESFYIVLVPLTRHVDQLSSFGQPSPAFFTDRYLPITFKCLIPNIQH